MNSKQLQNLEFENNQVLCIVQAMLGAINEGIRIIELNCSQPEVEVVFWVDSINDELDTDIEDILCDFEAIQENCPEISHRVIECSGYSPESVRPAGRLVYSRKQSKVGQTMPDGSGGTPST